MKFAIVESGGKQYRAVEGTTVDVDRLAHEVGKSFDIERVMLMADGDAVSVGTPTVSGIIVSVTVMEHIKGPKVLSFKYRPKKRIRVRGGNRAHYTRLMIDFIGKPGDKKEAPAKAEAKPKTRGKAEKPAATEPEAAAPKKPAKAEKEAASKKPAAAKKSTSTKKTEKK